jgi:hypothetical protein
MKHGKGGDMTGRGIGIGLGIFIVGVALVFFTPLRKPVLAAAGSSYPALQYRLRAERDTMDALQKRGSETRLSPAERASLDQVRNDYVSTREAIDNWQRANSRITLFGLIEWVDELLPWLLAFGLALPVFGGLIGAQVRVAGEPPAPAPSSHPIHPASVPLDRPRPVPPQRPPLVTGPGGRVLNPTPAAPVTPVRTTTPGAPVTHATKPAPLPGSPVPPWSPAPASAPTPPAQDWGFRHQPTPLDPRPRPKMPPVRSPNTLDENS